MTEDTAKAIASKIEELGGIIKAYHILDISLSRDKTPNINVQAPAITMPDIPPAVVKQPAINVQQADMTVPAPVIRIPESKPILQAPPVVNNIIKAVADSPVVKTFVKAVAAVPDIIVNPASPVLKPIITAMAKVPDVIVNQDEAPAIYPQAPNVSPVVNVPKADTPIVNAVTKVTEMAPILRPILNSAALDGYAPGQDSDCRWDLWRIPDYYGADGELDDGGALIRGKAAWYQRKWRGEFQGD